MEGILIQIAKTPLPTILVMAGIIFLFLAIVGKLGASIVVSPQKQRLAGLLGSVLLTGGLVLYFLRPSLTPATSEPPPTTIPPATNVPQALESTGSTKKPEKVAPVDIAHIAKRTRENWLFGNYNDALNGFALIVQKSDNPRAKKLAERRLNWLQPYRGRIIFADDFEIDTLMEGIWGIHPGYPQEEGSIFKRVQIDGNFVFEGYGHHHALAQRVFARFEKGDITANFEIHLKFYPLNSLECAAHINTTLDPQEGRFTVGLYMAEKRLGVFEERYGQAIEKGKPQVFYSRWYDLRVTVQGRHVRIFLDNKLMLDYESPSSQPLLRNFNLETLTGAVRFDDVLVITL
jgi:hypothetical protein